MARKKASEPVKKDVDKVEFQGFVNVYLSPVDKKQIKEEVISEDLVVGKIEELTADDYKVSISYSKSGGFYSVTAYGNTPDNPNAGWAMTLRHKDILVALTSLFFSHEYKSVAGDWEGKGEGAGSYDW